MVTISLFVPLAHAASVTTDSKVTAPATSFFFMKIILHSFLNFFYFTTN